MLFALANKRFFRGVATLRQSSSVFNFESQRWFYFSLSHWKTFQYVSIRVRLCTRMFACVYLCISMFVHLFVVDKQATRAYRSRELSACLPLIIGMFLLLFQFFALSLNNWNWKLTSASNSMPELLVSARPKKNGKEMNEQEIAREWETERERDSQTTMLSTFYYCF